MVSIIPTTIITVAASVNTYNVLYNQLITVNSHAMVWACDRLEQLVEELKSTFYAFEMDGTFRNAVEAWDRGQAEYREIEMLREDLVSLLDRSSLVNETGIMLYANNTLIKAEPAGVRIRSGVTDGSAILAREGALQRNVYLETKDGGAYAMHEMNAFEDRKPIATIFVKIRPAVISRILDQLHFYPTERILLANDANRVITETYSQASVTSGFAEPEILAEIAADGAMYGLFRDCFVFHRSLSDGKLLLVKVIPRNEIAWKVLDTVITGILVGVLCCAVSVFLSAFLSGLISRPIVCLAERVKNINMETLEMSCGDFDGDEIGILENHLARFVDRIRELITEEYAIKFVAKSAQLQALQAQINPHFLHNALQMIGGMALVKNAPEIYNITLALSDSMRYAMDFDEQQVPLEKEFVNLNNYLIIQKERFKNHFVATCSIQPGLEGVMVPKLLLQPLAENCFKHGFVTKAGKWKLDVSATGDEQGRVHVSVKDNGGGISEERLAEVRKMLKDIDDAAFPRVGNIGLANVHSRIKLTYAECDGVSILRNDEGGVTVEIIFTPTTVLQGGKVR